MTTHDTGHDGTASDDTQDRGESARTDGGTATDTQQYRDGQPTPPRHSGSTGYETPEEYAGSSGDGSVPDLDRRDYLKAVGAAGFAASLAGAGSGSATAQSGWEAEAEQRIEEHRQSELQVDVVNQSTGNAVSGADVSVEMQSHDFGFGTAVHAEFLTRGTEWGSEIDGLTDQDQEQYRQTIQDNFNEIVLENLHKWHLWDGNTAIADEAVDWALGNEMDVRGHVCIWGNVNAYAIPPDIVEAMGVSPDNEDINFEHDNFTQADHDPEYVRQESLAHIPEIIDHYGNDIKEWEVVNEVIHQQKMIRAVEGNGHNDSSVDALTAPILGDWYEEAEQVTSEYDDMGIAVNDYNTLEGNYQGERDDYETQIDFLVNQRGIDIDGIGFQGHFNNGQGSQGPDERLDPSQIMDCLDRFSDFGAGLRITEFDMFQGDWGDQQQADYMNTILKTFFSHPEAEDFLIWGHWTPLHWGNDHGAGPQNAPFYREDWSEKPALDVWQNLVFDEWWTSESGSTDGSGTYTTQAFHGEHDVTVTAGGQEYTETVTVTESSGGQVEISVDAEGEEQCDASSVDVGDRTIYDPDEDDDYEDFDGDCEVSNNDVVEFFQVQHRQTWKQPDLFDFSGNDAVGHGDVVSLFEEATQSL